MIETPHHGDLSMEQINGIILDALKKSVEVHLNRKYRSMRAVLTVNSSFNASQIRAVKVAARIAGLKCERVIKEPTAAVIAAGYHKNRSEKQILVLNIGSSNFDIAIVSISNGQITEEVTKGRQN